jgi:hypothetical protein
MANTNRPTGLSPVAHLNGSNWNGQANKYVILSTDTGQYGIGSAVKSFAGGDTDGVPAVTIAAAGNTCRGVIVSIIPQDQSSPPGPIPATKTRDYYVMVSDSPDTVYEIQANNSTAFPTSDLNSNANLVIGVPGSFGPFCTTQLDASTTDTTSTLQMKILGKVQRTDVDLTANTKLLVIFNEHELRGNTTAVA